MNDPGAFRRGSAAAALVTQMTVSTVLGGWLGRQLDARWNTGSVLQLSGFVAGFALGMTALLYHLARNRPDDPDPPDAPE